MAMASRLFWMRTTTHVTGEGFRCKRTRTTPDYSSLPDEINEQILLKLQCIKSILTCTSVCKSWRALIKSRGFITMHLSHPNRNAEYFLCCDIYRQFSYSIQCYCKGRLENYYDLRFPGEKRVTKHGSYNGLICYTKLDDVPGNIYLWNPAIRKVKLLPKSRYQQKHTAYGFWYDTNSDDYKVAKISCSKISKAEVYSLRSNSWDKITTSDPKYSKTCFDNGVHLNGILYWLAMDISNDWRLVSLNLKNGMFLDTLIWNGEKSMPRFVPYMLGVCSRSLFVLGASNRCMDIRVYDKSLNELYRHELGKNETESLRPLCVRNNGDEVLLQKVGTDSPILVFNIRELKFRDFCPSTKTIHEVEPFVETLVLLDDGDSSSTPNSR